jgi:XTP/dITP diphosphohydrolase
MDLVIATSNIHKLAEIRKLLPDSFKLKGLNEIGFSDQIAETGITFEENALIKARVVHKHSGLNTLSDDSGLMVESLDDRPGIYSARYAGEGATSVENINKLLLELNHIQNRKAKFKAVIALVTDTTERLFTGEVTGKIAFEPSGLSGFGYDPVFIPDGYSETFSVLPLIVKNTISHRAVAFNKLLTYLNMPVSRD